MLHNSLFKEIVQAQQSGASPERLADILGRGKAKKGMFEGDIENGELEIGQIASLLNTVRPASEIVSEIVNDFREIGGTKLGKRFEF
jgi:enoyl-[acyl-carrier protein] reductase II